MSAMDTSPLYPRLMKHSFTARRSWEVLRIIRTSWNSGVSPLQQGSMAEQERWHCVYFVPVDSPSRDGRTGSFARGHVAQ